MKKVTKFFMAALLAGMCSLGYGQTQPDYKKAPKTTEKVIGSVIVNLGAEYGHKRSSKWTDTDVYAKLLEQAKIDFPDYVIDIREMQYEQKDMGNSSFDGTIWYADWRVTATGKVVYIIDPEAQTYESLSQSITKALRNVREGSRLAIDQVSVPYSMEKETLKDQLLDLLLDKGYKVIAKDYLDKLYEEQQAQQSGIYNDNTTVQDNNFSAVGYYINVKVTETSLRVQVVNVSTGEYEGNATVNF